MLNKLVVNVMDTRISHRRSVSKILGSGEKRFLVTGGCGFIGQHLVRKLLAQGSEVHVLDDLSAGSLESLPVHESLRFFEGCVTDASVVHDAAEDCDQVFHLASIVGMRKAVAEPAWTYEVSTEGTRRLFEETDDSVPIVVFSSSAVYGLHPMPHWDERTQIPRDIPLEYDSGKIGYAVGKWEQEQISLEYSRYGREVLMIRPFNVIGPGQAGRYGMVVPTFIQMAAAGKVLSVYGNGQQSRCFSDVDSFLNSLLKVIQHFLTWEFGKNIINIGTRRATTVNEVAQVVINVLQSSSKIKYIPYEEIFPGKRDVICRIPKTEYMHSLIGDVAWPSLHDVISDIANHQLGKMSAAFEVEASLS